MSSRPWPQHERRLRWQPPGAVGVQRRRAASAVARVLTRPGHLPACVVWRGQQRLGHDRQQEVAAEIDREQPVVTAVGAEEPEHEGLGTRSEERRVGKESSCARTQYDNDKDTRVKYVHA